MSKNPVSLANDTEARDSRPTSLWQLVDQVDDAIDEYWERWRDDPRLDRLFYAASEAANHSRLWHALGLLQAVVRRDKRGAIELSVVLAAESAIVNGGVKSLFRRSRPSHSKPRPHKLRRPLTTSFPSGHASAAMLAATMLSRRSKRVAPWYALALLVAVSRIHVRLHHASDVIAGIAVGVALGALARRILR